LAGLVAAASPAVADFNVLAAGLDELGHHTSAHAAAFVAALEKARGAPEPIAADAPLKVGERMRIVSGFYGRIPAGSVESVTGCP
jgi:hypothetical protein